MAFPPESQEQPPLQPQSHQGEQQQQAFIPSGQASYLLVSFTHFLTVCIHNILYYRSIYPQETFLMSRAYNLPVHQSRHPKVCSWIRDAVDAVRAQLARGAAERVAVVVYDSQARVAERWMFDVSAFPAWTGFDAAPRGPRTAEDDESDPSADNDPEAGPGPGPGPVRVNWTDVDEQLRATVRKLAYAGEKMAPLPEGCTFTVAVELRDDSEAPIGHPQPWIPTQPNLQPKSRDKHVPGRDIGGAKTTPLRAVEAGPLFFECWVEEGRINEQVSPYASHE
ncbi:DNA-binding protein [Durotheca rogersii]|uniref:DNA-binding protein n=1 Tax=Durotheca rogersii TaxID=419775 RepID=UPI002220B36E|nr:DNA-binding protein [Durotheca rogersii]KAI5866721.1 DNA-binding protein [Durotheca rogersii]